MGTPFLRERIDWDGGTHMGCDSQGLSLQAIKLINSR